MDLIPLMYKQGLNMVSTSKIPSALALVISGSFFWFLTHAAILIINLCIIGFN